jgi:hypothetical protein
LLYLVYFQSYLTIRRHSKHIFRLPVIKAKNPARRQRLTQKIRDIQKIRASLAEVAVVNPVDDFRLDKFQKQPVKPRRTKTPPVFAAKFAALENYFRLSN